MTDQAPFPDLGTLGDDPPAAEAPAPDAAATSAASDPLPGQRRRGRPLGSKNKRPRTAAQIAAQKANLAKGRVKPATAAPTRQGPTDAQLREAVAGLYAMTGMGVGFFDQPVGQAVATCADAAAEAWVHLGQQSPAVRRALVSLTTAGAAGELIAAHMPLLMLAVGRYTARKAPAAVAADPTTNGAGGDYLTDRTTPWQPAGL